MLLTPPSLYSPLLLLCLCSSLVRLICYLPCKYNKTNDKRVLKDGVRAVCTRDEQLPRLSTCTVMPAIVVYIFHFLSDAG
jgi:hypothetical protein